MTNPARPITGSELAELRHELRTPVNHIVGYGEMLLEDAEARGMGAAEALLRNALDAARVILALIGEVVAPDQAEVPASRLDDLRARLTEPQERITHAMHELLGEVGNDPEFSSDIHRILTAAAQLVAVCQGRVRALNGVEATGSGATEAGGEAEWLGRILIVDDVAENREVLRRRLEREGYATESAESGRRALDLISRGGFDLVLLDMLMPEMDGYEVLEHIKDDPSTHDLPVIMISALDDVSSIGRCIERGAEDYLAKPFDPVLLRARITASLEKKRLRDIEREYLEQVSQVTDAASAMESGAYATDMLAGVTQRDDELGRLARVFDGMVAKISAREDKLKEQIQHLRAEIGLARESQEITPPVEQPITLSTGGTFAERFEILGTLGRGGMGTVYRARDVELGEEVAVKVVLPELVIDPVVVERFKSEIRLARRITHRNVVRSYDFGEWQGVYYLTMEYVEGITLRELIDQRGALEISSTLAIGQQLAESLVVAHEVGVIHRDIKPQNLLLDADGVLKVMDFGVAKLAERSSTLTEAGIALGTPAYMSPEQIAAEAVDGRSDLYAVGVVLYECLTGKLPYEAPSAISMMAKVLNYDPVAPVELNAEVPPPLSGLVLSLLAKKPENRVQSAVLLAEQLQSMV